MSRWDSRTASALARRVGLAAVVVLVACPVIMSPSSSRTDRPGCPVCPEAHGM